MIQFLLLPPPTPRVQPRGFAIFSSFDILFPTPGHTEKDNSLPLGSLCLILIGILSRVITITFKCGFQL